MNCIIIDDDKVSRILFEKYISNTESLNLLASFGSAVEAVSLLMSNEKIDLIFLDIEMPEMSGIELLKNLESPPAIIIISAKERYALEAIEHNVIDYLLKPVPYARFFKAVNKVSNLRKIKDESAIKDDGIFIKSTSNALVRLGYDEILWIEALENYVVVNTFDEKHTIHITMKAIESKLPEKMFIRVHRSFIINLHKVKLIEDNCVFIKSKAGEKSIPITKKFRNSLLEMINIVSK